MERRVRIAHDQSLDLLVETACRHWEARRRAAAASTLLSPQTSHAFTIAVSREAGTLGTAFAQEVGNKLGWHVYDHDLLELIAQKMRVRTALIESVDERQQNWLQESIEAFFSPQGNHEWVSEGAYVRHLVETVLALGVHGECVIVGRGASLILPPQTTLRVRLMAPVRDRIASLSQKLGISLRQAARQLREVDREHDHFVKDHFHKAPTDAWRYDLVLNAARLPIATETELIIEALHQLQAYAVRSGKRNPLLEGIAE